MADAAITDPDPPTPGSNPCGAELEAANTCISADPTSCTCFNPPFSANFPADFEAAFRQTLVYYPPDSSKFCSASNENVCEFLDTDASCCCTAQIAAYGACIYVKDLTVKYGLRYLCDHTCIINKEAEEDADNNYVVYGIIATVIAVLASIICWFFQRSRRRATIRNKKRNKKGGIQVNLNLSSNHNSTEQIDNNTETTEKRAKGGFFSRKEQAPKSSKAHHSTDSSDSNDDWNWDKYNDDDVESSNRSKRSHRRNKSELSESESSEEESKHRRRRPKSRAEESSSSSSESSDDESSLEEKKTRRRNSRVEESSSESSDDESSIEEKRTRHTKKTELRKKRRKIESWHEKEKERSNHSMRTSKRSREQVPENSVRQARSVMANYDQQKEEGGGEMQLALVTDIGKVLKLLEDDRHKAENRLREVEQEAQRLKIESVASTQKMSDLKKSQHDTELHIQNEQMSIDIIKTGTKETVTAKEEETLQLVSILEATRKQKEEMSSMIDLLKNAQADLESSAKLSKAEIADLAAQNEGKSNELILLEMANAQVMKCLRQTQSSAIAKELELLENDDSDVSECLFEEHTLMERDKSTGNINYDTGDDTASIGSWTFAGEETHPSEADPIDMLQEERYIIERYGCDTFSEDEESSDDEFHRQQPSPQTKPGRDRSNQVPVFDNNPRCHDGQYSDEWYSSFSTLEPESSVAVPREAFNRSSSRSGDQNHQNHHKARREPSHQRRSHRPRAVADPPTR